MRPTTRLLTTALVAALLLPACGGGGDDEQRQAIVDALTEGGAVTQAQAECVVDGLYDEIDADVIADLDPTSEEVDDPEVAEVLNEAFLECTQES